MTKEEFKTKYNLIYTGYVDKLDDCHREITDSISAPMPYLINYLRFLRDFYLLATPEEDNSKETELKVSAIVSAISEYEKYVLYKEKLKDLDEEKADEKTKKEFERKDFHWNTFWSLLALTIEEL